MPTIKDYFDIIRKAKLLAKNDTVLASKFGVSRVTFHKIKSDEKLLFVKLKELGFTDDNFAEMAQMAKIVEEAEKLTEIISRVAGKRNQLQPNEWLFVFAGLCDSHPYFSSLQKDYDWLRISNIRYSDSELFCNIMACYYVSAKGKEMDPYVHSKEYLIRVLEADLSGRESSIKPKDSMPYFCFFVSDNLNMMNLDDKWNLIKSISIVIYGSLHNTGKTAIPPQGMLTKCYWRTEDNNLIVLTKPFETIFGFRQELYLVHKCGSRVEKIEYAGRMGFESCEIVKSKEYKQEFYQGNVLLGCSDEKMLIFYGLFDYIQNESGESTLKFFQEDGNGCDIEIAGHNLGKEWTTIKPSALRRELVKISNERLEEERFRMVFPEEEVSQLHFQHQISNSGIKIQLADGKEYSILYKEYPWLKNVCLTDNIKVVEVKENGSRIIFFDDFYFVEL